MFFKNRVDRDPREGARRKTNSKTKLASNPVRRNEGSGLLQRWHVSAGRPGGEVVTPRKQVACAGFVKATKDQEAPNNDQEEELNLIDDLPRASLCPKKRPLTASYGAPNMTRPGEGSERARRSGRRRTDRWRTTRVSQPGEAKDWSRRSWSSTGLASKGKGEGKNCVVRRAHDAVFMRGVR